VLRTVYNIVHSYSEAEDITQEVFLKLHENPQNFESETHLKAWLLRSAINRAKNYHKSFRVKMVSPIDETNENCFAQDFTPEENELLEKVRNLPAKYSLVIYLYYYEGYSVKEIADMIGKSKNTVNSQLQRGREKLKMEIEEEKVYESKRLHSFNE
jgi:RNA polymerase sigma-70 factor (ECF subfamily)